MGLGYVWKCQQGSLEKVVGGPVEDSLIPMIAVTSVETGVIMPTTAIVSAREVGAAGEFDHGCGDVSDSVVSNRMHLFIYF